jgi:hypothetical protein
MSQYQPEIHVVSEETKKLFAEGKQCILAQHPVSKEIRYPPLHCTTFEHFQSHLSLISLMC